MISYFVTFDNVDFACSVGADNPEDAKGLAVKELLDSMLDDLNTPGRITIQEVYVHPTGNGVVFKTVL